MHTIPKSVICDCLNAIDFNVPLFRTETHGCDTEHNTNISLY